MSSTRYSVASRCANEGEISELICKLQALLPESNSGNTRRVPAPEVLKEVCSYIRSLNKEVDDLSETLSQLLASNGYNGPVDTNVLRNLLPL